MAYSIDGYKRDSKDVKKPSNLIPSGNITMKGVDFPVMGTDNLGNQQLMQPGLDYQFPGSEVFEQPMQNLTQDKPKNQVKKRKVDRDNKLITNWTSEMGDVSSHKMTSMSFTDDDGNPIYVAIPMLFPTIEGQETPDPASWTQFAEGDEMSAFEMAMQRGEVYYFNSEQESHKFAKGSWKTPNLKKRDGGLIKHQDIGSNNHIINNRDLSDPNRKFMKPTINLSNYDELEETLGDTSWVDIMSKMSEEEFNNFVAPYSKRTDSLNNLKRFTGDERWWAGNLANVISDEEYAKANENRKWTRDNHRKGNLPNYSEVAPLGKSTEDVFYDAEKAYYNTPVHTKEELNADFDTAYPYTFNSVAGTDPLNKIPWKNEMKDDPEKWEGSWSDYIRSTDIQPDYYEIGDITLAEESNPFHFVYDGGDQDGETVNTAVPDKGIKDIQDVRSHDEYMKWYDHHKKSGVLNNKSKKDMDYWEALTDKDNNVWTSNFKYTDASPRYKELDFLENPNMNISDGERGRLSDRSEQSLSRFETLTGRDRKMYNDNHLNEMEYFNSIGIFETPLDKPIAYYPKEERMELMKVLNDYEKKQNSENTAWTIDYKNSEFYGKERTYKYGGSLPKAQLKQVKNAYALTKSLIKGKQLGKVLNKSLKLNEFIPKASKAPIIPKNKIAYVTPINTDVNINIGNDIISNNKTVNADNKFSLQSDVFKNKIPLTRVLSSKGLRFTDGKLFSSTEPHTHYKSDSRGEEFPLRLKSTNRNTTHWSYGHIGNPGHGGGSWSKKSTAIINDYENLSKSGLALDLDPTDTWFYSKGNFEIPANSLILTRDKTLYKKIKKETNITNIKLFENTNNEDFESIVNSYSTRGGKGAYTRPTDDMINPKDQFFNAGEGEMIMRDYMIKNYSKGDDVSLTQTADHYKPHQWQGHDFDWVHPFTGKKSGITTMHPDFDHSYMDLGDPFGGGQSKAHSGSPLSTIERMEYNWGDNMTTNHGLYSSNNRWGNGDRSGSLDILAKLPKTIQVNEMEKVMKTYKNQREGLRLQQELAELNGFKSYKEFKNSISKQEWLDFKRDGGSLNKAQWWNPKNAYALANTISKSFKPAKSLLPKPSFKNINYQKLLPFTESGSTLVPQTHMSSGKEGTSMDLSETLNSIYADNKPMWFGPTATSNRYRMTDDNNKFIPTIPGQGGLFQVGSGRLGNTGKPGFDEIPFTEATMPFGGLANDGYHLNLETGLPNYNDPLMDHKLLTKNAFQNKIDGVFNPNTKFKIFKSDLSKGNHAMHQKWSDKELAKIKADGYDAIQLVDQNGNQIENILLNKEKFKINKINDMDVHIDNPEFKYGGSLPKAQWYNLKNAYNIGKGLVNTIKSPFINDLVQGSNKLYRGIGPAGYNSAVNTGKILSNVNPTAVNEGAFNLTKNFGNKTFFTPNVETASKYGDGYIAEINNDVNDFSNRYNSDWSQFTTDPVFLSQSNIYKMNMLGNYKRILSQNTVGDHSKINFLDNVKLRTNYTSSTGLDYYGHRNVKHNIKGGWPTQLEVEKLKKDSGLTLTQDNLRSYVEKIGKVGGGKYPKTTLYRYGDMATNAAGNKDMGYYSADPLDPLRYSERADRTFNGSVFKIDVENELLPEFYKGIGFGNQGKEPGFQSGTLFKEFEVPEAFLGKFGNQQTFKTLSDYKKWLNTVKQSGGSLTKHQVPKLIKGALDLGKKVKNIISPKNVNSIIDWSKVSPAILANKNLLSEYADIEMATKANATWMKNDDGTSFWGTPQQFIQVNSEAFKNSYPEGYKRVFRGESGTLKLTDPLYSGAADIESGNKGIFTANEGLAKLYTNDYRLGSNSSILQLAIPSVSDGSKYLNINGLGNDWTDLSSIGTTKKTLELNIKNLENNIKKDAEGFQWASGSGSLESYDVNKHLQSYKDFYNNYDEIVANPIYKKLLEFKEAAWENDKILNGGNLAGRQSFGTGDVGDFMEKSGLNNIRLNYIDDGGFGDVTLNNQIPGNYLKSLTNNNGRFNLKNPNMNRQKGGSLPKAQLQYYDKAKKTYDFVKGLWTVAKPVSKLVIPGRSATDVAHKIKPLINSYQKPNSAGVASLINPNWTVDEGGLYEGMDSRVRTFIEPGQYGINEPIRLMDGNTRFHYGQSQGKDWDEWYRTFQHNNQSLYPEIAEKNLTLENGTWRPKTQLELDDDIPTEVWDPVQQKFVKQNLKTRPFADPTSLYRAVNAPDIQTAEKFGTTIPSLNSGADGRRTGYTDLQKNTPYDVLFTTPNAGWIGGSGVDDPYNLFNLYAKKDQGKFIVKMPRTNGAVESLTQINNRTDILNNSQYPYSGNTGSVWNEATGKFDIPTHLGSGIFNTVSGKPDLSLIPEGSIVNPNYSSFNGNQITPIFGTKGTTVRNAQDVLPIEDYFKKLKEDPNWKFNKGGSVKAQYVGETKEDIDWTGTTQGEIPSNEPDLDLLKQGVGYAESLNGELMINSQSTATGLYGQRFSEVKKGKLYDGTREEFAVDLDAQNSLFEQRYNGEIKDIPGLKQSGIDLYEEYNTQITDFPYSTTEVAALVNFIGRQGTRDYLGYVLRDGNTLESVFPTKYGSKANQSNKTPNEYITKFNEGLNIKKKGGEVDKLTERLIKKYEEGGTLTPAGTKHLKSLGMI